MAPAHHKIEEWGRWTLLFFDGTSVEMYEIEGDPQKAAIELTQEFPHLVLMAAVKGAEIILTRDSGRTAECGLL